MHSLGDISKIINRPPVYLQGLQKRFGLPVFKGAGYSDSYLIFLQTVSRLRAVNISEDALLELWRIERKLLQLLHADSTGSPTWFLDSCGSTRNRKHRLLLSHFDIGVYLASGTLQLGLQFSDTAKELFTGSEMGEDALSLLSAYREAYARMQTAIAAEIPLVRAALRLANRLAARV